MIGADARAVHDGRRAGAGGILLLFTNLWKYRQVVRHLIEQKTKAQYKQSLFGYAWIILNPLAQLASLSFIFSTVYHTPKQGDAPFVLFVAVGLIPWLFFLNAISAATDSISGGSNLIRAVYMPREIIVIATIAVRIVDLMAGALIIAVLLLATGQQVGTAALLLPVFVLLQFAFVIGLSLPLAALNLFFHDVRYLISVVLYLWFFFTPVFYPLSLVPEKYRYLWALNPNTGLIEMARWALLGQDSPSASSIWIAVVAAPVTLVLGYYIFRKAEPLFADYL